MRAKRFQFRRVRNAVGIAGVAVELDTRCCSSPSSLQAVSLGTEITRTKSDEHIQKERVRERERGRQAQRAATQRERA